MKAFRFLRQSAVRLAREESGVALLLTLAVFLLLFILCCGVFTVGKTIRHKVELQNACDAAAYSGAVVQADGLSRMAIVNRAMAWTYIQLCRAQMDYIVYSWLDLSCTRFWEDYKKNARNGGLDKLRHCFVPKELKLKTLVTKPLEWIHFKYVPVFECEQCHHDSTEPGPGWYVGLPDKPGGWEGRGKLRIKINERDSKNGQLTSQDYQSVEALKSQDGKSGLLVDMGGEKWKKLQLERIDFLKATIRQLNGTLFVLEQAMNESIRKTVKSVLLAHVPANKEDYYWMTCGGVSVDAPIAYGGGTNTYFEGLLNTEEDELQFLSMADGVANRRTDAPAWMKKRPVLLSDYFGGGENPTETANGFERYVAGGLDQWYVRGSATESEDSRQVPVPQKLEAGDPDFRGGIRRVYKNSNREEGATWKLVKPYHRPNHIFTGDITAINDMDFSEWIAFFHPRIMFERVMEPVGMRWAARILISVLEGASIVGIIVDQVGTAVMDAAVDAIKDALKQYVVDFLKEIESTVFQGVFDIAPSNSHQRRLYWDQCKNVNETVGLVAEYDWASAYWFCFYWEKASFNWWGRFSGYSKKRGSDRHLRFPVRELLGCGGLSHLHGYGEGILPPLSWLFPELFDVLDVQHFFSNTPAGASRNDYESCFINMDGTSFPNYNTHLKGHARIYGDDKDIFNVTGYVGEVSCPWVLGENFFAGDGTIVVGLAKKQRNPFEAFAEKVVQPSIFEPFNPRRSGTRRNRCLVALSAARAAYAPRPAGGDGLGSVNTGETVPGQYEVRYDGVCKDHMNVDPWDNLGPDSRLGCACGDGENTERLARAWNLSQTDWDAVLLPIRFAADGHTPYDSFDPDPVDWEYEGRDKSGMTLMMKKLAKVPWRRCSDGTEWDYLDIMAFPSTPLDTDEDNPNDGENEPGRLLQLMFGRKLL